MKRTVAYMALIVLGALMLSSLMNVAKAPSISVGTYDSNTGAAKDAFVPLEDVRIIAQSSHRPITINILDPDNVEVYSETVDSYNYERTITGITVRSGWYTVDASSPLSSTRKNFATVSFNVVPEAPFGTVSFAIVSLGAFGLYGLIKRRKITSL